jgi:AraC-like DNA-binding protein/mannose-6-phosphate isomerase-like protein (cupin superfamily)
MKEFLYWGQVQERLSSRVAQDKGPCSFCDAVRELWEEGAAYLAEELPKVSFEDWDVMNLGQFDQIYNTVPVDLGMFYRKFQHNVPAAKDSEPIMSLDVILLRIACDQALGFHHHDFFEIVYVISGSAQLKTEAGTSEIRAGEFCFLSSGLRHDILPARGAQVISITIPGITIEQTLYRLLQRDNILTSFFRSVLDGEKTSYLIISVPEERRIREILRGLFHEYFVKEEYAREIIPNHLVILFVFILRQCGENYRRFDGNEDRTGAAPMLAILKYIQNHYQTTSLSDVAEQFHYEPSYLGKLIKNSIGKNYTDIVRDLRINEAKRLLCSTDLPVNDVAATIGCESRVHFFRSFRKVVGMTPGDYRKQHQQSES